MKFIIIGSWQEIKAELSVMFGREPWWAELWSATAAILWAVVSIFSHADAQDSVMLGQLESVSSLHFWEITGLIVGFFQLFSLLYGGLRWRWAAAFMASWWWVFLTITIYLASYMILPTIALYFVYACINLFSMVKLVRQYA